MSTVNHDVASRLIGVTPGELDALVRNGHIRRSGKDGYMVPVLVGDYCKHLRGMPVQREASPTQPEIAEHLDLSDRRVRELLVEWGIDHRTTPLSELRVRYIRKLREEAAGRAAAGDLDLATERALLARSQREKIDMANDEKRKTLMPAFILEAVLARAAARACPLLDTIPGEIRRRLPDASAETLAAIESIVVKARNNIALVTLDDLAADDDDATPGDPTGAPDAPDAPDADLSAVA